MGKPNRFTSAPKDILDIGYIVAVAEGRRKPDPVAFTIISEGKSPETDPETWKDRTNCYHNGFHQGFWCEYGGRVEVATPPAGMPRALLGSFAAGILDGAESALQYKLSGNHGGGGSGGTPSKEPDWQPITDPFADIHSDEAPGTDPADSDLDGDGDDDDFPGGHDHV